MNEKQTQTIFFFALLVLVGIVALFLVWPHLVILVVALALAILFRPVFNWLRKWARLERGFAALTVTLMMLILVVLPFTGISILVGREVGDVYVKLQAFVEVERLRGAEESSQVLRWIAENIRIRFIDGGGVGTIISFISERAVGVFSGVTSFFLSMFLFFVAFYYFMKDGHALRKMLFSVSPLSEAAEEKLYTNVLVAINATIRGSLIVALAQGALAGMGFWMFGVGAPILLGVTTLFASLVPILGTSLVLVPAIGYLLVKGSIASAIGLAVWGGVAVGLIDNILKPKLIEQRMKIHPLLILLSILGGLNLFGFSGLLVGPLVLAFAVALAEIYREEYHPQMSSLFSSAPPENGKSSG